jgi:hypothetical protein
MCKPNKRNQIRSHTKQENVQEENEWRVVYCDGQYALPGINAMYMRKTLSTALRAITNVVRA